MIKLGFNVTFSNKIEIHHSHEVPCVLGPKIEHESFFFNVDDLVYAAGKSARKKKPPMRLANLRETKKAKLPLSH